MPVTTLLKWTAVFTAGMVIGVIGTRYFLVPPPQVAPAVAHNPSVESSDADAAQLNHNAAEVSVYTKQGIAVSGALLFDGGRILVLPLSDLAGAISATWRDRHGVHRDIASVRAIDLTLGLAALDSGGYSDSGFTLAAEEGSLFLGREFRALAVQHTIDGWVDSPVTQNAGGNFSFELALQGDLRGIAAMLDPSSDAVIGIALPATDSDTGRGFDTTSLREFFVHARATQFPTLADFGRYYENSDTGQLRHLAAMIAARDWLEATRLSDALWSQRPGLDQQSLGVTLAFSMHAQSLNDAGRAGEALSVLEQAQRRFGPSRDLMLAKSQALASLNRLAEAIDALRAAQADRDPSPQDRALLRQWLLAATSDAANSKAQAIAMLRSAITDDDYAPFHRQLGILYFENGDYAQASRSLSRAIQLEPAFASDLDRLRERADQRSATPNMTEAPLIRSGRALFVDLYLNGGGQPFRFLLDTGASFTAVSHATVLRLGLNDIFARGAPLVELESANGPLYAQRFTLDSIDLNGARVQNVPVVILEELQGADGLLGLSYLSHFNIDIDLEGHKLILVRR